MRKIIGSRSVRLVLLVAAYTAAALTFVATVAAGELGDAVSGGLTPADVLTIGGASVVTGIITQLVLQVAGLNKPENTAAKGQYGAAIAVLVGIVAVGAFALSQHADFPSAILTGLLAGWGSIGVHDSAEVVGIG